MKKLWRWRVWVLEDRYHDGLGGPPNNTRSYRFRDDWNGRDLVVSFINDAHEVWIAEKWDGGGKEHWTFSAPASAFRRMALWYLWRWIWGEWFGLRR